LNAARRCARHRRRRADGQAHLPHETGGAQLGLEAGQRAERELNATVQSRAHARVINERVQALHERGDERLRIPHELIMFRDHLVVAGRGVELVAVLVVAAFEEVFRLAEERLLDAAVLENIERGMPQEALPIVDVRCLRSCA